MRATEPRLLHLAAGLLCAALGAAGIAACADSLHLDPPGDGGETRTDGGTACRSNAGCAYPSPVCDTVTATCVQCLTFADCAEKPGTVCSMGKCGCPTPTDAYCDTAAKCVDMTSSPTDC